MSLEKLVSTASRLFFLGAFVFFALAVLERIANTAGYTILRMYSGGRLLEFAVVLFQQLSLGTTKFAPTPTT